MLAGGEPLTAELIALAPRLRAIARTGVGYDAVDVAAATARKIPVIITPGTNQESVAEQTFALLLAVARRVVELRPADQVGRLDPGAGHAAAGQDAGPGRASGGSAARSRRGRSPSG